MKAPSSDRRWAGVTAVRRRYVRCATAASLIATVLVAPLAAQPPSAGAVVQGLRRIGVADGAPLELTLADVIQLALDHNNDVAVARFDTDAARQDVRLAESVFDPLFAPNLTYERVVSPIASALGGATGGRLEQQRLAGGLQFTGRAPWAGGRFTTDLAATRLETSNQFVQLNPQYPTSFGLSYVQPLFRGRTIDAERRQILLSREAADLTDAQLAQVLINQLTFVEQAYWDLVFATLNLQVQLDAVERARAQVASNERQAQAGTLAPIDVVEAQTQVANLQLGAAAAQQALTEAENRLKTLVLTDRTAPAWNRPLVPIEPVDRPALRLSLDEATVAALSRRPELAALAAVQAQNDIDRRFFANEAKPQVDLVANYSLAGLAGSPLVRTDNPLGGNDAAFLARLNELSLRAGFDPLVLPPSTGTVVPPILTGGYGQSFGNILAARFPTVLVQLQLGIPLGNRRAEANVARAEVAGARIQRQRQQLEQTIEAEVRNALEAVQTSQARLDAASLARRNALEQYQSERRRFEAGLSTVFLVLQRQTALVTTQAQELRARADLNQAAAVLGRATGTTLERHQVTLTPAPR